LQFVSKEIQYLEEIESLQAVNSDLKAAQLQLEAATTQTKLEVETLEFQLSESRTQSQVTEDALKQHLAHLEQKEHALTNKIQDLTYQLTQVQASAASTEQQAGVTTELEQEVTFFLLLCRNFLSIAHPVVCLVCFRVARWTD